MPRVPVDDPNLYHINLEVFASRTMELLRLHQCPARAAAQQIGVNTSTFSRYMNCQRSPELIYVVRLALLFDVSVDYLLGLDEERERFSEKSRIAALYDRLSFDDRRVVDAVLSRYDTR